MKAKNTKMGINGGMPRLGQTLCETGVNAVKNTEIQSLPLSMRHQAMPVTLMKAFSSMYFFIECDSVPHLVLR